MNKIFAIMTTVFFLAVGSAQAHCGHCGIGDAPEASIDTMVSEKIEMLTKELKLTDDQKAQIQTAIKDKLTKKKEIMDQKMQAMDALHEEFKTKLSGILSAEQMTAWEKMKETCPMCKAGEPCAMCKLKKGKGGDGHGHSHGEHGHDGHDHKE